MSRTRVAKEVGIVMATADMPAYVMGEDEKLKSSHNISTQDFQAQLSALAKEHKNIVKIALAVSKAGGKMEIGGEEVTRKTVNGLSSQYTKMLKTLNKNYAARNSKKRRSTTARSGDGLAQPSFITSNLRDFLLTANLGPDTAALRAKLAPTLREMIFNRTIMTPLMVLYAQANGLRSVHEDKTIHYRVDKHMEKYMGPYISALEAQGRDPEYQTTKKGKPRTPFDRNDFSYHRLPSITNAGFIPKADLTDAQAARVLDPTVKATLVDVQRLVSASKAKNVPSTKKGKKVVA